MGDPRELQTSMLHRSLLMGVRFMESSLRLVYGVKSQVFMFDIVIIQPRFFLKLSIENNLQIVFRFCLSMDRDVADNTEFSTLLKKLKDCCAN